jgi:hypothetical protein
MLPYSVELTLKTNGLILIFHIFFFMGYYIFKKRDKKKITKKTVLQQSPLLPLTILILFIISIIVFLFSYDFILDELSRPSWKKSSYSVSSLLLQKKVLFMIPFSVIILCHQYFKNSKKTNFNFLFLFGVFLGMFILLFWFKNPLTEKRNALGPIVISLIFLFFPKVLNTNVKSTSFLFFSMILLFPLAQIFTHADFSLQEMLNRPRLILGELTNTKIISTFSTLNYDAFSNISATIEYVSIHGFSFGYQLLSGLLFFIPRSIWVSKPNSTGQLIGEHIQREHDFSFTNLSNPLVSEGYINFGLIGVILMALALAYFIVKFLNWLQHSDELKRIMAFYFAIHLIFFLRGDFTNGFAYYIGTLIGVLLIPKIVNAALIQLYKSTGKNAKQKVKI